VRIKRNIPRPGLSTGVFGESFFREHPNFSTTLDALTPPPVAPARSERIEVCEELAILLRLEPSDWLEHKVRVRRVVPCPECEKPIVEVRFDHDGHHRVCDAVEGKHDEIWRANVLAQHECEGSL
jgi:hypothetical protein